MNHSSTERVITGDPYLRLSLLQIPRILTLQDRNPFSPTYGSFARTYWLDRTSDFPTALAQFATQALALVYSHDMPDNPYFAQPKVLNWIKAGMRNFISLAHDDGSFDEFYPGERGWAGPTGFLVHAMADSYLLLKNEIDGNLAADLLATLRTAGLFLGRYDEIGTLANHYAMAALAIRCAHRVTGDPALLPGYQKVLDQTLALFHDEGWGREYDGADIGYLSASVSFMSKLYAIDPDPRILTMIERAIAFTAYFVYPDGHFAGTLGSRNTLHFYPHGYELMAPQNPLAAKIGEAMVHGLDRGALVPPHIMADRYFLYRVPEFLLSYIDFHKRPESDLRLPYEDDDFEKHVEAGRYFIAKKRSDYVVANAGKGGVVKCFDIAAQKLVLADCGVMLKKDDGTWSSQWVDDQYRVSFQDGGFSVEGAFHKLPAKLFTPARQIAFRLFLILFAWNTTIAYKLKGVIRDLLMLAHKPGTDRFRRTVTLTDETLEIADRITPGEGIVRDVLIGDDIPVRYVPQSRYFQPQELEARGWQLTPRQIAALNRDGITHIRRLDLATSAVTVEIRNMQGDVVE